MQVRGSGRYTRAGDVQKRVNFQSDRKIAQQSRVYASRTNSVSSNISELFGLSNRHDSAPPNYRPPDKTIPTLLSV